MSNKVLRKSKTISTPSIRSSTINDSMISISSNYSKKPIKLANLPTIGTSLKLRFKSKHESICTTNPNLDSSFINKSMILPKLEEKMINNKSPSYFSEKLRQKLAQADNSNNEEITNIYFSIFDELAHHLSPFTNIMLYLKNGIVKSLQKDSFPCGNDDEFSIYQPQKLVKNIEILEKEKICLVKKLNKLIEELEKYRTENMNMSKKLGKVEKYYTQDYDELVDSSIKKTELLQGQRVRIEELTLHLMMMKKVVDRLRNGENDVNKVISEVENEFSIAKSDHLLL